MRVEHLPYPLFFFIHTNLLPRFATNHPSTLLPVHSMNKLNALLTAMMSTIIAAIIFCKAIVRVIPQFLGTPPAKWRVRINAAIVKASTNPNKTPVMDFGWKHGSVRRQMVLASSSPSSYTNKGFGNRIHVSAPDRSERDKFVNNLVPEFRSEHRIIYGFFHPYCNAGGGGEKVLWKAVESTLARNKNNIVAIYTGDKDVTGEDILSNVIQRFGYDLDKSRIVFVFLNSRYLVDSTTWPRFTLIGQAIGSIFLSLEALYKLPPDVWCETMGYPFAYPFIYWFAHIPIITYTHYPVISSDMLDKLRLMPNFKSSVTLKLKYFYWKLFMLCYKFAGKYVEIPITNSTWTNNHIKSIWTTASPKIIYPPCTTENLVFKEPTDKWTRLNQAVVIAQFRPEKRHELIIKSFAAFLKSAPEGSKSKIPKLILIGSTRSDSDKQFVQRLQSLCYEDLKIPHGLVEFHTDCKYEVMKRFLRESSYGINAMWNEHFGIAVVEYVASGLIPLVHASAGPLLDIVVPWDSKKKCQAEHNTVNNRTGFFFRDSSDPDYTIKDSDKYPTLADLFVTVTNLTDEEKLLMSQRGKECVLNKFSDLKFHQMWDEVLDNIETIELNYAQERADF